MGTALHDCPSSERLVRRQAHAVLESLSRYGRVISEQLLVEPGPTLAFGMSPL